MTEPATASVTSDVPFSFSFELAGAGWANAEISGGGARLKVSASYLTDALADLLRALESLWDGATIAHAYWEEEPGYYHWECRQSGNDYQLRILARRHTRGLDPQFSPEGDPLTLETAERGNEFLLFSTLGPLRELTAAIVDGAVDTLAREGQVAYLEKWVVARFPLAILRSVQAKALLGVAELPPVHPQDPHPNRGALERIWRDFVKGAASVEQTSVLLQALDARTSDPVLKRGCWMLEHRLRHGELSATNRQRACEELEGWLHTAARYASDPLGWHSSQDLRSLATALRFSSDISGLTKSFMRRLDRDDIDALIDGMGLRQDPISGARRIPHAASRLQRW